MFVRQFICIENGDSPEKTRTVTLVSVLLFLQLFLWCPNPRILVLKYSALHSENYDVGSSCWGNGARQQGLRCKVSWLGDDTEDSAQFELVCFETPQNSNKTL